MSDIINQKFKENASSFTISQLYGHHFKAFQYFDKHFLIFVMKPILIKFGFNSGHLFSEAVTFILTVISDIMYVYLCT